MDEISGMLQKIRTLAVQASNGTNTTADKQALSKEASSLATEITRIAKQTTFAGKTILNGKQTNSIDPIAGGGGGGNPQPPAPAPGGAGADQSITLQVGSNKGDTISFALVNLQFSAAAVKAGIADGNFLAAGGAGDKAFIKGANDAITINFTTAGTASDIIGFMDQMIGYVDSQRADLGATQNRLESSIRNQSNVAANEADARSRIRDADFAQESANLSQQSIIQQAAASMLMQANTRPQLGLSLLG